MEETNKKSISKSIIRPVAIAFIVIALAISISSIFLTFSLREVYLANSSDSSFKDHKKEYKALGGNTTN